MNQKKKRKGKGRGKPTTILRCEAAGRWTDGLIGRRSFRVATPTHRHFTLEAKHFRLPLVVDLSSSAGHRQSIITRSSSTRQVDARRLQLVCLVLWSFNFSESLHFSSATRLETQHWYTERDNERRMEDVVQVEDEVGLFGWIDSINFFPYLYIYFLQDSRRTAFQITSPLSPSSLGDPSLKLSTHLEL
ncbi:hypothetical protein Q3G72_009695 [Acer saccharum]|nr:hypothetical protein Q3G72_009695 [Acer saccharum]